MHPKVLSGSAWKTVRDLVARGLTESWTLAGGTALALQLGHRYSEDLDFFRLDPFDTDHMLATLSTIGEVRVHGRSADTLHLTLQGLRLSFLQTQEPLLFPGTPYRGLVIADPRDIAVMKVIAVGGRGSRKDFVDLYFILQGGGSIDSILALVKQRFSRIDYNAYHLMKSLVYFDDAESEPMPKLIRQVEWNEIKKTLRDAVRAVNPR